MDSAKPWQIAVVVIGLLAGAGTIVYSIATSDSPKLANSLTLVDVETGDLFVASVGKGMISFPVKSPATGKHSLMPVYKTTSGNWAVADRYIADLGKLQGVTPSAVDVSTGSLTKSSGSAKSMVIES